MLASYRLIRLGEDGYMIPYMRYVEQTRFDTVVQICREVGDLIGQIDDLRLDGRPLVQVVGRKLRVLAWDVVARVLDDAFANAQGKIQAAMGGVSLFEVIADPKRVEVVIEVKSMPLQTCVQGTLACVAEGGMSDVVNQRQSLREIFVQTETAGDIPGYLCDFDRVREPRSKVIGGPAGEDLCLTRQTAKRTGLDDALAIPLKTGTSRSGRCRVNAR